MMFYKKQFLLYSWRLVLKLKAKAKASDSYIARLTGRNLTSRALQSSKVAVDRHGPVVLQR